MARALLAEAAHGAPGALIFSLIVADANAPANALYRSESFAEVAREPMPPLDGWKSNSTQLVAMLRALPL